MYIHGQYNEGLAAHQSLHGHAHVGTGASGPARREPVVRKSATGLSSSEYRRDRVEQVSAQGQGQSRRRDQPTADDAAFGQIFSARA